MTEVDNPIITDILHGVAIFSDEGKKHTRSPVEKDKRISIDFVAADGGEIRSQDDWITYFDEQNQLMVSASDIYHLGKKGYAPLI